MARPKFISKYTIAFWLICCAALYTAQVVKEPSQLSIVIFMMVVLFASNILGYAEALSKA